MNEFDKCINNIEAYVNAYNSGKKYFPIFPIINTLQDCKNLLFEYQIEINELKGVLAQKIKREIENSLPKGLNLP